MVGWILRRGCKREGEDYKREGKERRRLLGRSSQST